MQYTRGVPGEYNAWAQSGCKGWSYEELRPYFERAEGRWSPVTSAHYGMDGRTIHYYICLYLSFTQDFCKLKLHLRASNLAHLESKFTTILLQLVSLN